MTEAIETDSGRAVVGTRRILVVFAHPDDAEFCCAGSVARWAGGGAQVGYLVATDGRRGANPDKLSPEQFVLQREREQREAAGLLGVSSVAFLRHPDGELSQVKDLSPSMAREIRRFRPDLLLTFDPWRRYQLHPDHRSIGQAVLDAILPAASESLAMEESGTPVSPHRVQAVLLFVPDEADHFEDVTETMEIKLRALRCHRSQVDGIQDLEERVRSTNAFFGEKGGCAFAEAYKALRPFCDLCQ